MHALETQVDALAIVYARSLFEAAEAEGGRALVEEIAAEFEEVIELTRRDARFVEFLRSAILPVKARGASLEHIFKGRVNHLLLQLLIVLNRKERLARLAAVAAAYDQLVQEKFGRVEVDVYTPAPLEGDQLERLALRLKTAIGRDPVLHPYTDPTMIGGLRLRIGDQMIDASVATRLRKLRERLATHGVAEVRGRAEQMFDDDV